MPTENLTDINSQVEIASLIAQLTRPRKWQDKLQHSPIAQLVRALH